MSGPAPLAASLDSSGQVHVWSSESGLQQLTFTAAASARAAEVMTGGGNDPMGGLQLGNSWEDMIER